MRSAQHRPGYRGIAASLPGLPDHISERSRDKTDLVHIGIIACLYDRRYCE
jgi:hypothetical protein